MARTFTLPNGKSVTRPFNKAWISIAILVVLVVFFLQFITYSTRAILPRELLVLLKEMFTPQDSRTWGDYFAYMLTLKTPLLATLQMSFAGTLIGSLLAVPVAVLAARNIVKTRFVYVPMRIVMNVIRTIPAMILALIATFFVGIGVLSGILAITFFTFGIMAKMLYEVIETIDMSPYEALESTGANKIQAFRYAVMPQIFPIFLSYLIYIFEINVRSSAVLGYVGAGGIGTVIKDNMLFYWDHVGAAIIVMLVVILIVQFLSNYIRGKLQ
jgi:phosphonate transport system permease protein